MLLAAKLARSNDLTVVRVSDGVDGRIDDCRPTPDTCLRHGPHHRDSGRINPGESSFLWKITQGAKPQNATIAKKLALIAGLGHRLNALTALVSKQKGPYNRQALDRLFGVTAMYPDMREVRAFLRPSCNMVTKFQ